jgi:outer membrane receptor for ferrienterochelin and colicin
MEKNQIMHGLSPCVVKLLKTMNLTVFLVLISVMGICANETYGQETLNVNQQTKSVTGTVTDEDGEPLPGVTVAIKGTTQGTTTNFDGVYSLNNVTAETELQFSFVGMKTQVFTVGGNSTIDVVMLADAIGLEEVVAVGYGSQKKVNLTGAVSAVSAEVLESRPVQNVGQALQGIIPGLNFSQDLVVS